MPAGDSFYIATPILQVTSREYITAPNYRHLRGRSRKNWHMKPIGHSGIRT